MRGSCTRMNSHYLLAFACLWGLAQAHPSTGNLCATIRATQSSLKELGEAGHAIDGNANTDCSLGSCSSTKNEKSPWWRVDLFYHYRIYIVRITASKCGNGLSGAEIHIGDSVDIHGHKTLCAKIEAIRPGQTGTFHCQGLGVHGHFLTIVVPGHTTELALCEVEAYGLHEPHHEDHDHDHLPLIPQ